MAIANLEGDVSRLELDYMALSDDFDELTQGNAELTDKVASLESLLSTNTMLNYALGGAVVLLLVALLYLSRKNGKKVGMSTKAQI